MKNDNTTPMSAKDYDNKIINTIPYYNEFYNQTFDIISFMNYKNLEWLDLGCGTGTLEEKAFNRFTNIKFTVADPSEQMLEQAKVKLSGNSVQYICSDSAHIEFTNAFNVITAIQSHHYMHEPEREVATHKVYSALKDGGIYISFENVVDADDRVKEFELQRWGSYQFEHGKSREDVNAHLARCGTSYFPLTVQQHVELLKNTGFSKVHVFWQSFMQMGIYGIK